MDRLHNCTGDLVPAGTFAGETLLVMTKDSDFKAAKEINLKYCSSMEVVEATGTHYDVLQAENASAVASSVLAFLRRLGHPLPDTEE